jgi:hypothetical protein
LLDYTHDDASDLGGVRAAKRRPATLEGVAGRKNSDGARQFGSACLKEFLAPGGKDGVFGLAPRLVGEQQIELR